MSITPAWVAKEGNDDREYEDACWPNRPTERATARVRVAVADGASEAMLSGKWADILVRTFCRSRSRRARAMYTAALAEWDTWLADYLETRERDGRPVRWFEEPGLERGAFSTLTGLLIVDSGRWTALALGDSCLFRVSGGALAVSFPATASADFDSSPPLVPSKPRDLDVVVDRTMLADGEWKSGDRFYLATDALAAWFLAQAEAGALPWDELDGALAQFPAWVADQRAQGAMKNDDVTLLRVAVD